LASAGLLFAVGLLLGLALSPTLTYYASVNPQALWQAGGATALFIADCGTVRYATRRDLSALARAFLGARRAYLARDREGAKTDTAAGSAGRS
jgi:FtsH-binding integral membrane protein